MLRLCLVLKHIDAISLASHLQIEMNRKKKERVTTNGACGAFYRFFIVNKYFRILLKKKQRKIKDNLNELRKVHRYT